MTESAYLRVYSPEGSGSTEPVPGFVRSYGLLSESEGEAYRFVEWNGRRLVCPQNLRLRVLESRRGLQRKPSAARSRQARDLNVGRFVPDMRDVETVERVQIDRQGEDEYPQPPEAHGFVISQWCSLHAQRLDRINAGRTPGRKVAREESGEPENHGHRDEYGRVERAHAK